MEVKKFVGGCGTPDLSILLGEKLQYRTVRNAVIGIKRLKASTIETNQAAVSGHPDYPVVVLVKTINLVAGQAIICGVVDKIGLRTSEFGKGQ